MAVIPDSVYEILSLDNPDNLEARFEPDRFRRGRVLFHDGSVLSFKLHPEGCSCKVAEDALYPVTISLEGGRIASECGCGEEGCAHVIAALLTLRSKLPPRRKQEAKGAMRFFREHFHFVSHQASIRPHLQVSLDLRELASPRPIFGVSLRLETSELIPIREPEQFLASWSGRVPYRISSQLTYEPGRWRFTPGDEEIFHLLAGGLAPGQEGSGRTLSYRREFFPTFMAILDGKTIDLQLDGAEAVSRVVDARRAGLVFDLAPADEGGVSIRTGIEQGGDQYELDSVRLLPGDLPWGMSDRRLFPLRFSSAAGIKKAMSDQRGDSTLRVEKQGVTMVMDELLPFLQERGRVELRGRLKKAIQKKETPPGVVLRIDMEGLHVRAELLFRYGNCRIAWAEKGGLVRTSDYRWQRRRFEFEQEQADRLATAGFSAGFDGVFLLEEEEAIFRFIYEFLPGVQDGWDILYSSRFRQVSRRLSKPTIGMKLTRKYNFMELQIKTSQRGVTIDPLAVLESARAGHSWVRLQDGQFLPLSEEQQDLLQALSEKIDFRPIDIGGRQRAGADPIFVPLAADILNEGSDDDASVDEAFLEYSRSLISWNKKEVVPSGLKATLRGYQVQGFSWLVNIYNNGLGGILADDMGLGKTIQTITLMLKAVAEGEKRPFLIICPSSLAFNWMKEIQKFAPSLRALNISGNPDKRGGLLDRIPEQDVVVISYALLQRDQEALEKRVFASIFLDEAQHIKNPGSGRTKSAKAIKASSRFALTGTPIENSLGELWSLFDFVLPGYLFTYRRFKDEIERPVMERGDESKLDELRHRIAPFMLRRTKKDVLKQLPRKTEQVVSCPMHTSQREAYLSVLAFFDTRLLPLLEKDGIETHSLEILAALTRLRQICCHPGLALDKYADAESGKMDVFFEIIDQAVDGGHKTLVFSQFTGMLNLIQTRLEERMLNVVRLDGSTTVSKRGRLVDSFNEDPEKHVFLISLKAGGTGLNLTSADTVIHVDPWWNPAAEDQASARAYRMGQKNPVNVYKLIAENSVEEKILCLQQDKKKLFEAVVGSGGPAFTKFSLDQIRDLFRT